MLCRVRGWERAGSLLAPGKVAFFLLLCCCKIAKGWDVSFPSSNSCLTKHGEWDDAVPEIASSRQLKEGWCETRLKSQMRYSQGKKSRGNVMEKWWRFVLWHTGLVAFRSSPCRARAPPNPGALCLTCLQGPRGTLVSLALCCLTQGHLQAIQIRFWLSILCLERL